MTLQELIALATFVAIGSGSPGPNNTLLLASGVTFGFASTVPHVVGTAIGISLLVGLSAIGVGAAVAALPALHFALKVGASAYLLWLAYKLARWFSVSDGSLPEPFSVLKATGFQFINPKGWFFALALAASMPSASEHVIIRGSIVLVVVAVVVGATATLWAAGGSALSRALEGARARRIAGIVLGAMLAGSVVFLWA